MLKKCTIYPMVMLKLFKRRKLRVDIAMIFATVLLGTTLGIIGFTYYRHVKAILNVANNLVVQMDETVINSLNSYLRPSFFMHMSNQILQDKTISPNEIPRLNWFFHEALDIYPRISTLYLADTHGNFYLQYRVPGAVKNPYSVPVIGSHYIPQATKNIYMILRSIKGKNPLTVIYKNDQGNTLKTEKYNNINFIPSQRPWYQGARQSTPNYWFGVYRFFTTNQLGLTVASPSIIHHQFSGVIGADFTMDQFVQQFKNIIAANKSGAIIYNKKGDIIAYQGFEPIKTQATDMVNIKNLHDSVIKTAYVQHQKNHYRRFIFSVRGTQYIAYISPYASNSDENWEIEVVVPVNTFIGAVKSTNYYTIIFSIIMVSLGLILVFFASGRISKPIMSIADDMKKMQQLNFSAIAKSDSSIYEIQTMLDALRATQSALSSFVKYIPKALVGKLLENKTTAQLGGVKKTISILFTDIDNYTATVENMDAEALIAHISEYLNVMTSVIHQHEGNIDKYIGDAIMAFWNDPIENPNHVFHACQAILACQMQIKMINAAWRAVGKPVFTTRFGLNTGVAIAGNVGSQDRINYTVIGDNVNVTARLEALNKIYGTEIIVSESVYQQCQDQMLFRPLDTVTVRGKQHPIKIYELIAAKSAKFSPRVATAEEIVLCELSTLAYQAFHRQEWGTAYTIFTEINEKFPQDGMARLYLKRISELVDLDEVKMDFSPTN